MYRPCALIVLCGLPFAGPAGCSTVPRPDPSEAPEIAEGIEREFAADRAEHVSRVHYDLAFRMQKGMAAVEGDAKVTFELDAPRRIVLDFAGHDLTAARLNGDPVTVDQVHNHLVIDAALARAGENVFEATFKSKVAPTGTPLTVYRDKTDGAEYYYTLNVPADAHRLFPCFDQPDIKGTYALTIDAPKHWRVIGNGAELPGQKGAAEGATRHAFATTKPLSTYLFAFAAGPFQELACATDKAPVGVPMRIFVRESKLPRLERDTLFAMHADATRWLGDYFRYPYPFGKLDCVILPGFPYGGMEHAGAIFYRESALVFDQDPTEGELSRRSTLIYHEVSHQWFGNLVTMKWFDDLWLKEGFATFMGYTLFETLEPGKHAWLRFLHRVKPAAYSVDATAGTTPVYQRLGNLADAKSAYGAIVYNKAPAILRELNHRLGPATFQRGLQIFLARHEFANATWEQLVSALEEAAETSTSHWSSRWILAPGMPSVSTEWTEADGKIASFTVDQRSVQGGDGTWPLQLEVLLLGVNGEHERVKLVADQASNPVPQLVGREAPACVLLNPRDIAYGQFLVDPRSRAWIAANAEKIGDPLVRAVAMTALWETVREAELDPAEYVPVALRALARERDAGTHSWLFGTLRTALLRYMPREKSAPHLATLTETLSRQLQGNAEAIKTQTLRYLISTGSGEASTELRRKVAAGESPVAGLKIGKRDRFLAATALLGTGHGRRALDGLIEDFHGKDIARDVYIAGAAAPHAKRTYFDGYQNLDEPPEQWISGSLGAFHWPGQEKQTLPFLRPALERVDWVKKNRKVFFMPAWIGAFVNGHSSEAALQTVETFLSEYSDLSIDIRRKILQSLDSLQRAVRIQRRWK